LVSPCDLGARQKECKKKQRRAKRVATMFRGKMVRTWKERIEVVVISPKRKKETKITIISMNKVKKWLNSDNGY
jgi:hypothetical protein